MLVLLNNKIMACGPYGPGKCQITQWLAERMPDWQIHLF